MSFSTDIKTELCSESISSRVLAVAEAYGVLLYCRTFSAAEVQIVTGSEAAAQRLPKLFRRAFGVSLAEPKRTGRGHWSFHLTDRAEIAAMFEAFGLEAHRTVSHHVNLSVLEEPDCAVAFLRGAFLAGGSVTDPHKGFHMELTTAHYSVSREVHALLAELGFPPHDSARSGSYMLYYKRADVIADLLTLLGAQHASLEVMSAQVERDMNNKVNRQINCDSANADKVVATAQQQLEAILRIKEQYGLDILPEKLHEAALLRIANPEASLADLAKLSFPSVTKSTLNYRLKKIMEFQLEDN